MRIGERMGMGSGSNGEVEGWEMGKGQDGKKRRGRERKGRDHTTSMVMMDHNHKFQTFIDKTE